MAEMAEDMKVQIVTDALLCRKWALDDIGHKNNVAPYIIKLVRALDSYRERDDKGRFLAKRVELR